MVLYLMIDCFRWQLILRYNDWGGITVNKFYFTTVVSSEYLYKVLVMHQTLKHHCTDFNLFIMCADDEIYKILQGVKLSNTTLLRVQNVENDEIEKAKADRSNFEFCWTLKPVTLNHVMKHHQDADYYAHLDADLCFFANPDHIFDEAPEASLYLVEHRYSLRFQNYENQHGRFNTGFVGCRNTETARTAIQWWEERCLERCSQKPDATHKVYGDQWYVERWPELFGDVHNINGKGVNAAAWNIEKYRVSRGNKQVYIDQDQLIFYHFSGFKILDENEFNLSWFYPIKEDAVNIIYLPYMHLIKENIKKIRKIYPAFQRGFHERNPAFIVHRYKL